MPLNFLFAARGLLWRAEVFPPGLSSVAVHWAAEELLAPADQKGGLSFLEKRGLAEEFWRVLSVRCVLLGAVL